MRIALVDDELIQLQQLQELLSGELARRIPHTSHRIDTFQSGRAFMEQWQAGKYDVIILDIFMGVVTGVDVAKMIRQTDPDVKLVFCSRSNEFAAESYQVNAQYYLVKPATPGSISNMLQRLNLELIQLGESVTLPDGQRVLLRKVLYTEYHNHVVTVHLKDMETCRVRTNHATVEEMFSPCGYIHSPSKGILVNFHEITACVEDSFTLSDGTRLPISRRKSKEIQAAYIKFNFQKMRSEVDV